ncbi:hypothetical protein HMI54_010486 [Coelomomyces lativittatus]|nr:hypothetical protein HMI56_002137 [Coelomomyces lativittatus]KAJ1516193.1 hypothetical protein HMI54_010486 [Coelomomyces lativittatus]KAJ1518037.1 hypothetical protein HMI55_003687 [Coelomomyces lativittatus]
MLIPKKNRDAVYRYVYDEGVLVAKKDTNAKRHLQLTIPNLHVLKCMQSLESKGYVKSQFSWQYFYYVLTDAGMSFLNQYFKLPAKVLPKTFKKKESALPQDQKKYAGPPRDHRGGPQGGHRESGGGRDDYRRAQGNTMDGKESAPPSGVYVPKFTGVGRGRSFGDHPGSGPSSTFGGERSSGSYH